MDPAPPVPSQGLQGRHGLLYGVYDFLEKQLGWRFFVPGLELIRGEDDVDIPEGFFVSGTLSAEQFGEAFLSEIELQMQEIRRKLTEFNAEINASIGAAAGTVTNDNRSTTYHIYGDNSGSTVKQIQNMETIKRLSGQ